MSSKTVGLQQQGRRTPLSLAGGKSHHQNQHNINKTNQNSSKNQDSKDSNITKNHASNGNNNTAKNSEIKDSNSNHNKHENKKNHQNDNNKQNVNDSNVVDNGKKVNDKKDDLKVIKEKDHLNGTAKNTGNNNDKATKPTTATTNGTKETKESGKEQEKDIEAVKDKPKKSTESTKSNITENKKNEIPDKPIAQVQPTKNTATKDGKATPIQTAIVESNVNDKTQNIETSEIKTRQSTPSNSNTINNENEKSVAITATYKSPTSSPSGKSSKTQPSKSPKGATTCVPIECIEIDDEEMAPLAIDRSPLKKSSTLPTLEPAATSTPGKVIGKCGLAVKPDIPLNTLDNGVLDRKSVPRSFSEISGRRSIRSVCGDYTPGKYSSHFRESYRRINTELDVTSDTNTSMNVTVGSEIPNNSSFLSFSIFGRGRKRERTPPLMDATKSQSAVELTTETTPPKRARLDMHGLFTVMSSPLTMLRTRFSKATIETPSKNSHDEEPKLKLDDDVQNVSGLSVDELVSCDENTVDITVGKEANNSKTETSSTKTSPIKEKEDPKEVIENNENVGEAKEVGTMDIDSDDIKATETPVVAAVGDPKIKQKGCLLM